ncbi:MAG: polysaccharide deacetylase family protein [Paludibacteraceae bacterium]|nr:polysaccharide deacetylase family protein [Paludibacteraceae bacterium]
MKNKVLALLAITAFCTNSAISQEIATWENFCKAAVTFTFDDAAREVNSHTWAAQQMEQYGFRGTFYMVTSWSNGGWSEYKSLAQKGHEIGSHTDSHDGATAAQLSTSKKTIEQNIGQPCLTIAYPNCQHLGNSVLDYYIGGRICGGQINEKSPKDLSNFDCVICGTNGANSSGEITSKCSSAINKNGWAVFLIHGIQGRQASGSWSPTNADALTGALSWLNDRKTDYWVCTARDAIMYLKERDNATLKKISSDNSSDTYSLTLNSSLTSNKLCEWNYPLTIRVPKQDGWANIKVSQSGNDLEFEEKGDYIYFKAIPGKGDITVGSGQPAVPDPEFSISVDKADKYCKDSTYKVTWTASGDFNDRTYVLNWGTGSSSTEISISDVSASSEWGETESNPYWTVDKILDDDGSHGGNSRWGSMSGSDEWVEFKFSKSQSVGGITIDECTEYSTITSFEIQYDENGSWKTAYTGKTVGHDFTTTFSPVSTSKMRLFIKSTNDGAGCNINFVKFTGVAGYVIKEGITAAGSVDWKPKSAGTGMLTITSTKNKVITQTASMKIENCGDEQCTDCGGPEPNPGASTFFDENGAYFGPECESDGSKSTGAFYTGDYTSLFKTYLGKTDEEIQKKLDQLWNHYFKGNDNQKVYYDKGSEAYILDTGNNDVRSEGMSYGMMICVQTNHKEEFDKLWKFAKTHMRHTSGQWDGYFKWQCNPDGSAQDQNCAPDGEMYFVTALLLAANRWNDPSYREDAQYSLSRFWKNGNGSLFNENEMVITFQPYNCSDFSDPSYDLPAFVDLFSRWSTSNQSKWKTAAQKTRDHLYKSSNTKSGLFSDYNNFNGTPHDGFNGNRSDRYLYDAMRCAMNFGMDYYLFGVDAERQEVMAKRIIDFFESNGYKNARFDWDGSNPSESYTLGETGANAVACYALVNDPSYESKIKTNLNKAWSASLMTGQYRYYDGLVHYLAMLHLCGSFKIYKPAPSIEEKTENSNVYNGVTYDKETVIESFENCQLYRVTIKGESNNVDETLGDNDAIVLVPNPAENYFVVKSAKEIKAIELFNIAGQKVLSQNNGSTVEINLPAGSYIVKIQTTDGNFIVKKLQVK